jgi:serine/threonine protein kinase, bacterial
VPACDGSYVVFVAASVTPGQYAVEMQKALNRYQGANYLRTDQACSSLRAATPAGNAIYAAYMGPYGSKGEACAARSAIGGDAYVKILDSQTPPSVIQSC